MDIQTRKLKAIENLMDINDEDLLKQVELFINEIQKQQKGDRLRKLTKEEVIERAKKSNEEYNQKKRKPRKNLSKIRRIGEEPKSHMV